jgi:hypothetical protein
MIDLVTLVARRAAIIWVDAEIRVNRTESRFAAYFTRLLQQNRRLSHLPSRRSEIARTQFTDAVVVTNRASINALALNARLPTMSGGRESVDAGGLLSYGPNFPELWRRSEDYIDKILRGAKPADIPVEQPTKFELVIDLKTAKALGLTVPPPLLTREFIAGRFVIRDSVLPGSAGEVTPGLSTCSPALLSQAVQKRPRSGAFREQSSSATKHLLLSARARANWA